MTADDIVLGDDLSRAGPDDARLLGDITADAFRNDPFNAWLFGNFAGIEHLFRLQARRIYSQRGYCYTSGTDGACMWMMPGGDASFNTMDYAAFVSPCYSIAERAQLGAESGRAKPWRSAIRVSSTRIFSVSACGNRRRAKARGAS